MSLNDRTSHSEQFHRRNNVLHNRCCLVLLLHGGGGVANGGDRGGHGMHGGDRVHGRLMDGDRVLPHDRGLHDLVDRVHLVGGGHGDRAGHLDGVWLLHGLLDDHFAVNGHGLLHEDLIGHAVHLQLGLDASHSGGDASVGAHGSKDALLSHGVRGGRAVWDGCRGDDSGGWGGHGESWGSDGHGLLGIDSLAGHDRVGLGLMHLLAGDVVLMTHLDGLSAHLHRAVSDNSVLHIGLGHSRAWVIRLLHLRQWRARGHHLRGHSMTHSDGDGAHSHSGLVVGRGGVAAGQQDGQLQKKEL